MASKTGTPQEIVLWLMGQDQERVFECRERRKPRSLTQNAYYWALNDKLAAALRMDRFELHFNMLRKYGACDVASVLVEVPLGDYFRYYDVFAHGTLNGREYKHVRIYKRSSAMDSAEFSRLLDGEMEECRQQGIETKTPEEVARLEFIAPKEETWST